MDVASMVEAMGDPTRAPYVALRSALLAAQRSRAEVKESSVTVKKLPMRVFGNDLQRLQREFGWHFKVTDRATAHVPFAEAKAFCCSALNAQMKAWDGEEIIIFDGDVVAMAVKNEGWVHTCRTNRTAEAAAQYVEQHVALARAAKGVNSCIAMGATAMLKQLNAGGGARVCLDAVKCTKVVDTLLVDLHKVDVAAEQLGKAVIQHQATRAKIWFFFEMEMFFEDEGNLTSMEGTFHIDRDIDKLFIYPAHQDKLVIEYTFSVVLSYVLQSVVHVDGVSFVMEVHDSMPGVKFAQMTRSDYDIPNDSVMDIHYYRANSEDLTVLEQWWTPVISGKAGGVVDLSKDQQHSRVVLPTAMVDRILLRVVSVKEKKLTLEVAREAVRDAFSQEITHGTVVKRPRVYSHEIAEQMAQYAYKSALAERLKMQLEVDKLKKRMAIMRNDRFDWISSVLHSVAEKGMSYKDALVQSCREYAVGDGVTVDYRVSRYKLDMMTVVRNVVRGSRVPREFGARRTSHMPGAYDNCSVNTSVFTADVLVARARAVAQHHDMETLDLIGMEVEDVKTSNGCGGFQRMSVQRDELVEKMVHDFDAHDLATGSGDEFRVAAVAEPLTTEQLPLGDPISVINSEYVELFPQLEDTDVAVRTHLASAADRNESFFASQRKVNRALDVLAPDQQIRRSAIKTAGGGKRALTTTETLLCFNKRVLNAPRVQGARDFDDTVVKQFETFAAKCMRPDYKSIVAARVNQGMWQSRVSALGANVRKTDQAKVTRMLTETFSEGAIDFTRWKAMVKSVPKPKMSEVAAYEHAATQTIVYQENKTENAYFSSMFSEFHDVLDECLLPNVKINVRRDMEDQERWFNSYSVRRKTAGASLKVIEADISQCDKSHTIFNWALYLHFLQMFGMPAEMAEMLKVMVGKKEASAAMVGMLAVFVEEITSGFFATISFNSIVCAVALVNAIEADDVEVVTAQFVGDDSLLEVVGNVDVVRSSDYMRDMYNLESKLFESTVRYFCSRYYVEFDGYFFFVRDPIKFVESLGKHISAVVDVGELYQSFVDGARHYNKREVCEQLAMQCAVRMRLKFVPNGIVNGIASLYDKEHFFSLYGDVSMLTA